MAYEPSLAVARFLLSTEGETWLDRAAQVTDATMSELAVVSYLRRRLSRDQTAAVIEQVQLRMRAAARFEQAGRMLFTDAGLQQSTHPLVARPRARRFDGRPLVADLGCGIAGDSVALAETAETLLAVDRDAVRLLFARHNADVHGVTDKVRFVGADILSLPFRIKGLTVFCDPSRRTPEGRRIFDPDHCEPPLGVLWDRLGDARGVAIKVAPGIAYESVPWADEIELLSLEGQVKEATLWCKDLATPGVRRRASLLPSGATVTDSEAADGCDVKSPGHYLYEPDGAVIRAGLVAQVGTLLGLWLLDKRIAYLSSDERVLSPFVRTFKIEEELPYGLKPIRRRLRDLDVGVLEIKKRGVAWDPDDLRRRLKVTGNQSRTLILTRVGAKPVAFLCRREND